MWTLILLTVGLTNVLWVNGRLPEKSTREAVTELTPRRVNRQVFDEDIESQENSESIEQQQRLSKEKRTLTDTDMQPLKRRPRSSNEVTKLEKKNTTTLRPIQQTITSKAPLIKKPIPKFNELETYEDFQSKVMLSPVQTDNMEHEDEDFNVDDYDFDAAHDEFSGRGKPLVPRQFRRPPKKEVIPEKPISIRNEGEKKKEKKTGGETATDSQGKKVKKAADISLGIINIPDRVSRDTKTEKNKYQIIEKGYNAGGKKDLVGLASREGVYDFVFYRK